MNSMLIFINTNEPASSDGSSLTYTLLKHEEKENVPKTSEITELPHLPTHAVASPRCSPSPVPTRTPV